MQETQIIRNAERSALFPKRNESAFQVPTPRTSCAVPVGKPLLRCKWSVRDRNVRAAWRASEMAHWQATGGDFLCKEEPLAAQPTNPAASVGIAPKTAGWAQRVSRDPESRELVNFPFVFSVLSILFAGSAASVCGMCLGSIWIILTGAAVVLAGSALYGASLCA
jgi:hypothetical protein